MTSLPAQSAVRVSTGVRTYDIANWRGGLPRVSHVQSTGGMSSLLQNGGPAQEPWVEIDVPPAPEAVLVLRTGPAALLQARLAGTRCPATIRRGDGFFLMPGTDSGWAFQRPVCPGWFHLHFSPRLLAETAEVHGDQLMTLPQFADPHIGRLCDIILDAAGQESPPNPLLWESLAHVVLWQLGVVARPARPRHPSRGGLAAWQVRRTTEYLADNLERRVSLGELAGIARLSPFHFARAFAQTVGMPPYRYQQKLRLERAGELLAGSDMRIIDVALAVGYESPQALARVFARAHGLSPSQWRQRHQEG